MNEDKFSKYTNDVNRGKQAESLLLNPLFIESFELVEQSFVKELTNTNYNEVEHREELYRRIQILRDVKQILSSAIKNGKISEEKLTHFQKAKKLIGL